MFCSRSDGSEKMTCFSVKLWKKCYSENVAPLDPCIKLCFISSLLHDVHPDQIAIKSQPLTLKNPRVLFFFSGLWVKIPLVRPPTGSVFIRSWDCKEFHKNPGFVLVVMKPGSSPRLLPSTALEGTEKAPEETVSQVATKIIS